MNLALPKASISKEIELLVRVGISFSAILLFMGPVSGAGRDGADFLSIPVGAAPAALGSAYSALASNAYAPVWNPAGLGFLPGVELAGQHLSYLESIHHEFVGLAFPVGVGRAVGLSAQYLGTGDIPETDNFANRLGTFSSHFGSYSLAFGQRLGDEMAFGATGKIVEASIAGVSAHTYAADIGFMFRPSKKLSVAAVCDNAGGRLQFLQESDTLPLRGHLAMAYALRESLLLSLESIYGRDGLDGRFGAEWAPIPLVALRAGYRSDVRKELSAIAGASAGVGIRVWNSELAYAWLPFGDLGDTHYFSLQLHFGSQTTENRRNLIQYTPRHHVPYRQPQALEIEKVIQLLDDEPSSRHASYPLDPSEIYE